jgi:hypothetical protein
MMKLPNPDRAIVDTTNLRDYCLSPTHPRGRHKARVFAAVLGLTATDADTLRAALLTAAIAEEATLGEYDVYGQRLCGRLLHARDWRASACTQQLDRARW